MSQRVILPPKASTQPTGRLTTPGQFPEFDRTGRDDEPLERPDELVAGGVMVGDFTIRHYCRHFTEAQITEHYPSMAEQIFAEARRAGLRFQTEQEQDDRALVAAILAQADTSKPASNQPSEYELLHPASPFFSPDALREAVAEARLRVVSTPMPPQGSINNPSDATAARRNVEQPQNQAESGIGLLEAGRATLGLGGEPESGSEANGLPSEGQAAAATANRNFRERLARIRRAAE